MKNTVNGNSYIKDVSLWAAIAVVTLAALFSTYYFVLSSPVKVIIWILWSLMFLTLGYFTSKGQALFEFGIEAKIELQKVVWPNRQETVQTTTIVMVMVTVTGFVLWGIDSLMMWTIAKITHLG